MNIAYYALTYSKIHYPLTREQFELIMPAAGDREFELSGNIIRRSNISDFVTAEKYFEVFPEKSRGAHQPYGMSWEDIKALPPMGYTGIISQAKRISHLEALARGINKAVVRVGGPCVNANKLLVVVEARIKNIKNPKSAEVARPIPPLPETVVPHEAVAEAILPDPALEIEVPF